MMRGLMEQIMETFPCVLDGFVVGLTELEDLVSGVCNLNERDREEVGYEDDENEDMKDDLRLNYINEADREYEDDENENMEDDMSLHEDLETNNNQTEFDGSEDEFENEDAELELIQDLDHKRDQAMSFDSTSSCMWRFAKMNSRSLGLQFDAFSFVH
ncbi:hypothetical protein Tco_0497157 [Tanacetum coccineum]